MSNSPLHLLLFLLIPLASCTDANYYWREYAGNIPPDALVGGADINGENVYMGQAYVKNSGLIPVQIKAGVKEVYAPMKGAQKVDRYIKILCGALEDFAWVPTNATDLHLELLNRQVVTGGHEDETGRVVVGRIGFDGGTQIGKINTFPVGKSYFRWVDVHKKEREVTTYDVLVYQKRNE
jgi:hypothetical protein